MTHEDIRYIALDMDGTILDRNYVISPAVVSCLRRCRTLGKKVVISTGRVYGSARKRVEPLGDVDGFVCSNGADVYAGGERPILEKHMDEALSRALVEVSRRHDSHFHAFVGDSWYYESERAYTGFYARRTGTPGKMVDFDSVSPLKFTKGLFVDEHDRLEVIAAELRAELGGRVQIMYSDPIMLEVVVWGVDKATGLEACVGYLGGNLAQTIAFGDAENDEPMLLAAGVGVAMGNADEALKAKTDYVAPTVDQDGVALFLADFFAL